MKYGFSGDNLPYFTCEADNDENAIAIAEYHFGEALGNGRWNLRDEGEDENCNIVFVHYERETPLYVLSFSSPMYPEDNATLGVFTSESKAREKMKDAIESDRSAYPNHPRRHQQQEYHYRIEEFYLDE